MCFLLAIHTRHATRDRRNSCPIVAQTLRNVLAELFQEIASHGTELRRLLDRSLRRPPHLLVQQRVLLLLTTPTCLRFFTATSDISGEVRTVQCGKQQAAVENQRRNQCKHVQYYSMVVWVGAVTFACERHACKDLRSCSCAL